MAGTKAQAPVIRWKEVLPWVLAGAAAIGTFFSFKSEFEAHVKKPAHAAADRRLYSIEQFHAAQGVRWDRQDERWTEQKDVNAKVLNGIEDLKER